MNAPIRLLESALLPARRNIAITAALAELHCAGRSPDTLRLCRYRPSVLVGRNQRIEAAVRTELCERRNVDIVRRVTDGRSVYMNPGMLGWELVADRSFLGDRLQRMTDRICSGIATGLARFGLPACNRMPGEVEVAGRQIAIVGGSLFGPTAVFQGAILIDVELSELTAFIRTAKAHQDRNRNPSRVFCTLSDLLGRVPAVDELKAVLAAALSFAWERDIRTGALTATELNHVDRFYRKSLPRMFSTGGVPPSVSPATEVPPS